MKNYPYAPWVATTDCSDITSALRLANYDEWTPYTNVYVGILFPKPKKNKKKNYGN